LAAVVIGSGTTTHAYNLGMLEVHGFASIGYLQSSDNDIYVSRTPVDHRWRDALGFKLGKVKRLQGLYGDVRDYDFFTHPCHAAPEHDV
jgi:hypothetical protein